MAKIFHASLHGLSKAKDLALLASDIGKTEWSNINLEASSFYLLIPQNSDLRREYDQFWKITEIMKTNVLGFQTHRDHFAIDFDRDELLSRIQEMFNEDLSNNDYAQKYSIEDNRDWKINEARQKLRRDVNWKNKLVDCLYRPFDKRPCYFSSVSMDYPRPLFEKHILGKDNLCLITVRQVAEGIFNHVLVTEDVTECRVTLSNKGAGYCYPLYLYDEDVPLQLLGELSNRHPNLSQEFLNEITIHFGYTPIPEAIFHYMYAIFNSPTYRSRYAEFLKGDFPRVPITRNVDLFHRLGELGEQLVNLHLMKSPILNQTLSPFINNGGSCIVDAGHPKYESGKVVINKEKDGFVGVPEAVWNFQIGGYQVCHKWLKDRKGRTLSQDDIGHYQKIVVALGQSIKLMNQIDEAIPSWPIDAEYN
jgi:predicted helicase